MEDSVVLEEVNDNVTISSATSTAQQLEQNKGDKSHLIVWQVALT